MKPAVFLAAFLTLLISGTATQVAASDSKLLQAILGGDVGLRPAILSSHFRPGPMVLSRDFPLASPLDDERVALEKARQSINRNRTDVSAIADAAAVLARFGKWDEAFGAINFAVEFEQNAVVREWADFASAAMREGDTDTALKAARHVLHAYPSRSDLVAYIFEELEQWEDLIRGYQHVVQANPANEHAKIYLARAFEKGGRLKESIAAYGEIASTTSDESVKRESFHHITQSYLTLGRYADAARTMLEAESSINDRSLACQLIYSGSLTRAQQRALANALRKAFDRNPGFTASGAVLADLYLYLHEPDNAAYIVETIRARAGNDFVVLRALARTCQREPTMYQVAIDIARNLTAREPANWLNADVLRDAYARAQMKDEAIDTARFMIANWPTELMAVVRSADVLRDFEAWSDAIQAWTQAVNIDPKTTEVWRVRLAETYRLAGLSNEARNIYESVYRSTRNEALQKECRKGLAKLGISSGDPNEIVRTLMEAEKAGDSQIIMDEMIRLSLADTQTEHDARLTDALEGALQDKGDLMSARLLLAALYLDAERVSDASRLIMPVLDRVDNVHALVWLASASWNPQDWELPVALIERAVVVKPDDYHIWCNLAGLYSRVGKKSEAVAAIAKVTSTWPDDAWAHFYAGTALAPGEHSDLAIQVLNRGLEIEKARALRDESPLESQLQWSCLSSLARIYEQRGETDKVVEILQRIIEDVDQDSAQNYARSWMKELTGEQVE